MSTIGCEAVQYIFQGILEGAFDARGKTFGAQNTVGRLTLQDMQASYGGAMSDMFGEQGAGSVVKKACMMSLGMDVADFSTMLQNSISAADNKPTVGPVWVQTQVDTFNPITNALNIQYKFGTYVMAGLGSDVSFEVVLTCDKKFDHPYCDPEGVDAEKVIYAANVAKGTTHQETIQKADIGATQWYNAAYIRYRYEGSTSETNTVHNYVLTDSNEKCRNDFNGDPVDSTSATCGPLNDIGGKTCCKYSQTQVRSGIKETVQDRIESKEVIRRGGMVAECYLSASVGGGLVCGSDEELTSSSSMRFIDVEMPGVWYEGQDVYAILELDRKNYGKNDFLVYYEVTNKDKGTKIKRAQSFSRSEVFGCSNGGETTHVKIPIKILGGSDTQQNKYMEGHKDNIDAELESIGKVLDGNEIVGFTNTNNQDGVVVSIKSLELTSVDGQTVPCGHAVIDSDGGSAKSHTLKSLCGENFDFTKLKKVDVIIDGSYTGDLFFEQDSKKIVNIPVYAPGSSASKAGSYDVDFKLYYCTADSSGQCGVDSSGNEFDIDDNKYRAIIGNSVSDAGQKKSKSFTVNPKSATSTCGGQPKLYMLKPLENNYLTPNYKVAFFAYDDCEGKLQSFTYKFEKGEEKKIAFTDEKLEKIDSGVYSGSYRITLDMVGADSIAGEDDDNIYKIQDGAEADVVFKVSDEKSSDLEGFSVKIGSSDGACVVKGLTGN